MSDSQIKNENLLDHAFHVFIKAKKKALREVERKTREKVVRKQEEMISIVK